MPRADRDLADVYNWIDAESSEDRLFYRIAESSGQVEVLHIRHGAKDKLKREDLR